VAPTTFAYPPLSRVRNSVNLVLWAWFLLTGSWFLLTSRLSSINAYVGVSIVTAYCAVGCYRAARRRIVLSQSFECRDDGLHVLRAGQDVLVLPWSELREIRPRGDRESFVIASTLLRRPLEIDAQLDGIETFRALVSGHLTGPTPREGPGTQGRGA
jgi:hypothetical protein